MCNPERLAENVLPRYFRHTQYSSWVRTLNHYSFRKTRPGQWANPHFQRDKPELLQYVKRKVTGGACGIGGLGASPSSPHRPSPPSLEFDMLQDLRLILEAIGRPQGFIDSVVRASLRD